MIDIHKNILLNFCVPKGEEPDNFKTHGIYLSVILYSLREASDCSYDIWCCPNMEEAQKLIDEFPEKEFFIIDNRKEK